MLNMVCPRKHPLNAKPIPQFYFTNYLALINRSSSIKTYYQAFSNSWVVRNLNFPVLASGLQSFLVSDNKKVFIYYHARLQL